MLWSVLTAGTDGSPCLKAYGEAAKNKGAACSMPERHQVSNPEDLDPALLALSLLLPLKKSTEKQKEEEHCPFLPITLRTEMYKGDFSSGLSSS